jgi:hypothetical protein
MFHYDMFHDFDGLGTGTVAEDRTSSNFSVFFLTKLQDF